MGDTNMKEYYTPSIEDLYIGYKYIIKLYKYGEYDGEICNIPGVEVQEDYEILTKIIDESNFKAAIFDFEHGLAETKYLDRGDIESLGWEYKEFSDNILYSGFYELGNYWLIRTIIPDMWLLHIIDSSLDEYAARSQRFDRYRGPIKSINELKTIMKWLNIIAKPQV
jgi:hypothetical protein